MDDYRAYPNLTEAAAILQVSPSTLSRREVPGVRVGGKELRLLPATILAEAAFHRRRPLPLVAGAIVSYAHEHSPESVDQIRAEVDAVMVTRASLPVLDRETFLAEARRALPRRLFAKVAAYYPEPSGAIPPAMATEEPMPSGPARRSSARNIVIDEVASDARSAQPQA